MARAAVTIVRVGDPVTTADGDMLVSATDRFVPGTYASHIGDPAAALRVVADEATGAPERSNPAARLAFTLPHSLALASAHDRHAGRRSFAVIVVGHAVATAYWRIKLGAYLGRSAAGAAAIVGAARPNKVAKEPLGAQSTNPQCSAGLSFTKSLTLPRSRKANVGIPANAVVRVGHTIAAADRRVFSGARARLVDHTNPGRIRDAAFRF